MGPITLGEKCAGARSAGNPHAACEAEGTGNGATASRTEARCSKGTAGATGSLSPPRQSSTLPGWRKITRAGVLHAISVAAMAMTSAWSRASRSSRQRASAEVDRLGSEIAQLTEELDLKDSRWARVPARRCPALS